MAAFRLVGDKFICLSNLRARKIASNIYGTSYVSLKFVSNLTSVENKSDEEEININTNTLSATGGIPFMFLPHTAFKPYFVHETTTSLPKIFDKYKWLTKTISSAGFPDTYKLHTSEVKKECVDAFEKTILQAVAHQQASYNKNKVDFVPERIDYSLLMNLLRISMSASSSNHLKPQNSNLYHYPLLETHWVRNYKFYVSRFKPSFVLRTREKLELIEQPRELMEYEVKSLPGPFTPYDMNVYERAIVHLIARPASDLFKYNPIKNCHTTIVTNNRLIHEEHILAFGLMTMFSQLSSQAQAQGVLHGTNLKEPLVTQCIITNGHKTAFMLYQLNTLNFLCDKGVWNRAWYLPVEELFQRKGTGIRLMYEMAEKCENLKGFNEQFSRMFYSFITKETC